MQVFGRNASKVGTLCSLCGVTAVLPEVGATLASGVWDEGGPRGFTLRDVGKSVGRTFADAGIAVGAVAGWQLACDILGLSFLEHSAIVLAAVAALSSRRRGQTWMAWGRALSFTALVGVFHRFFPIGFSVDFGL